MIFHRNALFSVLALVCSSILLLIAAGLGCGSGDESRLQVMPFPGTPDASPQAQVVFISISPADLGSVEVKGSRSGIHAGTIASLREDGGGAVFTPEKPFQAGERVTVKAETTSATAAEAAGSSGGSRLTFTFTVATAPPSSTTTTQQQAQQQPPPTWEFKSRPDLHPPQVTMPVSDDDKEAGYILLDAQFAPQNGPLILDGAGNVVWFLGLPAGQWATDLAVQTYRGKPVLTWWQGSVDPSGHGAGVGMIVDGSYRPVAAIRAGAGYQADLHEFVLTPRDTALITVYTPVRADLTSIGRSRDGAVWDCVIQEIDIASGRVLWEWHALGHVPVADSHRDKPSNDEIYDFFHVNSVQELDNGDLLVSARNTWAVYRIDRNTGAIVWQLGGKRSSFKFASGTRFEWQHDARMLNDTTLTLFNNAADPGKEDQSRALVLTLDTRKMTAAATAAFVHSPPVLAGSQGSVRPLPNGDWFVGWGDQPYFTEYKPDGTVVLDGKLPGPVQSYRAQRERWSAQPADPPVAVKGAGDNGQATVLVSWNGATGVAEWRLIGGASADRATVLAKAAGSGFETAIPLGASSPAYLAVQALDASGRVLATTEVRG